MSSEKENNPATKDKTTPEGKLKERIAELEKENLKRISELRQQFYEERKRSRELHEKSILADLHKIVDESRIRERLVKSGYCIRTQKQIEKYEGTYRLGLLWGFELGQAQILSAITKKVKEWIKGCDVDGRGVYFDFTDIDKRKLIKLLEAMK